MEDLPSAAGLGHLEFKLGRMTQDIVRTYLLLISTASA